MSTTGITKQKRFAIRKLVVPLVVMVAFVGVGIWGFLASGYTMPLIMFGYIGVSLGIGLSL